MEQEDTSWAFPLKSDREIKAVQNLCAISDSSGDLSYEEEFNKIWEDPSTKKDKKRNKKHYAIVIIV